MAVYKVPQDVEAEDKLIGPFSFRQFIYLGIVAMSLAAAWGLFLLFKPLCVIPLPIALFFGLLALPLRKDQPMETYLAAMWQFYIKPRRRMWMADGVVSRITIDIPTVIERQLTKNITGAQAISQFDYLSQLADTGGWSSRGVAHAPVAVTDTPAEDMLDGNSAVAQSFDTRLHHDDDQRREDLLARVHSGTITQELAPPAVSVPAPQPAAPIVTPPQYVNDYTGPAPVYDPTPKYMHQQVIQPMGSQQATPIQQQAPIVQTIPETPPQKAPEPSAPVNQSAILELAKDVSVETVARQLHHEEVERHADGEVVINLH